MSYFQLPDFSSQPSGLCYACFCQPYSPKILSFRRCFPPIIKSHHLSIKKQQIQQQNELFRLSLCYLNTTLPSAISSDSFLSPHFQQAVQHPTIIHNSPSFAYCPSLHTQTYAPLLSCERGVQLISQGIPKTVFSLILSTTLKYNACRHHDLAPAWMQVHFGLIPAQQDTRISLHKLPYPCLPLLLSMIWPANCISTDPALVSRHLMKRSNGIQPHFNP